MCVFLLVYEDIEIIVDPPSISLRAGEEAQFACSARSHIDVESIEWSKEGARLPAGHKSHRRCFSVFIVEF